MTLAPESSLGTTVKDVDENYFINFSAGVSVLETGHSNSDIVKAIKFQCEKLIRGLDFPGIASLETYSTFCRQPREYSLRGDNALLRLKAEIGFSDMGVL